MAMQRPLEISFPVPRAPHAILHCHLTSQSGYTMVHLTTSDIGESSAVVAPLGSFVYAMPDQLNQKNVLSTTLCATGSSVDYAVRLSKILARKLRLPVYVGCSMSFAGITLEEEMEGLSRVVDEIMSKVPGSSCS